MKVLRAILLALGLSLLLGLLVAAALHLHLQRPVRYIGRASAVRTG